ncbi:MAG: glycosyltransferase family 1 protein [Cucumibacter sp.]
MSRVLIATDAWHPQVNGVVRCLEYVGLGLGQFGHQAVFLTPERFWTMPMPTYPEIRLSLAPLGAIADFISKSQADHIHIATEGPLGLMTRIHCVSHQLGFTTSYHTRYPEYVAARLPVPPDWSYAYLRWFHSAAATTLVPTRSVEKDLTAHGFRNLTVWARGVDAVQFSPGEPTMFTDREGPILLHVGRVAVEKNVEAFLKLDVPGTKVVVGDGPQLEELRLRYPQAVFTGTLVGSPLVAAYRSADTFVFPSRTDTFGNVMIEALACGVPVAAYPVMGPVDVLTDPEAGAMSEDLGAAVRKALTLSRSAARKHAEKFTWSESTRQFVETLVPARPMAIVAA